MHEPGPDDLMRRFQARGDLDALGRLFDAVAPDLLGVARRVSGDIAEAEDLVHAAFLVAIERPERWRGDASVTAWLAGILSKEALNARRRAARRPEPDLATLASRLREERGRPAEAASSEETRGLVARAIQELPRLYREVVERHLADGETPSEIARAIDAPASTVRVRLHRGLARLRDRLPAGAFGAIAVPAGLGPGARGLDALRADLAQHAAGLAHASAAAATTTEAAVAAKASFGAGSGAGLLTLGLMGKRLLLLAAAVLATVGVIRLATLDRPDADRTEGRGASRVADLAPVDGSELDAPAAVEGVARLEALSTPAPDAAAVPDRAADVLVRTLWSDGTPAPDIAFEFVHFGDASLTRRSARTGPGGEVLLTDLTPGQYALYGDRGGHSSFTAAGVSGLEPPPTITHTWTLPGGTDVRGRVVDADGAPVAGAEVWVTTGLNRDAGLVAATTGADGAFEVKQLGDAVFLGARRAGYAPSRAEHVGHRAERAAGADGAPAGEIELELVLPSRGASLRGSVVGVGGAPIAGARVRVGAQWQFDTYGPSGAEGPPPPVEVVTDARGEFSCDAAAPGTVAWACRAESYAVAAGEAEVREGGSASIVIRMEPGARVRGRVVDASGAGVPGVWVSAYERAFGHGMRSSFDSPRVQSDAAGEYELFPLAAGAVTVMARADGGGGTARAEVEVAIGEERTLDLVLEGVPEITGTARDADGAPLAGWTVVTRPSQPTGAPPRAVRTRRDGAFTVAQPGRGRVDLLLYAPDDGDGPWTRPSAPVARVDGVLIGTGGVALVMDPASAPRARVTGRLDAPAPGAVVRVWQSGLGDVGFARIEGSGVEFEVEGLPAGDSTLTVEAEGRARVSVAVEGLGADEVRDVGELTLPPAGELRVVVTRADGRAPERAHVQILGPDGAEVHATREAGGRAFVARDLPVGDYRIRATAEAADARGTEAAVREARRTDVEIELAPGAPLGIVIAGPGATPLEGAVALVVKDAAGRTLVEEDLTPSPLGLATRWLPAPFGELEVSFGPVGGRRETRVITHRPGNREPMRFELAR